MILSLNKRKLLLPLLMLGIISLGQAEDISVAPADIQAALTLKLLVFHEKLASSGDITIYVVNGSEYAQALKKAIGKPIGSSKLSSVIEGDDVPKQKPSVVYLGNSSKLDDILSYCRSNSTLSITGDPELIYKGVTLGFGVSNEKPKVLLNLSSSKLENIDWNPAILKVAITTK